MSARGIEVGVQARAVKRGAIQSICRDPTQRRSRGLPDWREGPQLLLLRSSWRYVSVGAVGEEQCEGAEGGKERAKEGRDERFG